MVFFHLFVSAMPAVAVAIYCSVRTAIDNER